MKIKEKCSCGQELNEDNITIIGVNKAGTWYNCPCGSTLIDTTTKEEE